MNPRRRDALGLLSGGVLARWLAGCDRLLLFDNAVTKALDPITSNEDHYVYSVFPVPDVDPDTHTTYVRHEDQTLAAFNLAFLEGLTARDREHTLQCIGSGPTNLAISNAVWSGLPLLEVFEAMGIEVPASAVGLRFVGADASEYDDVNYHAGVPIEDLEFGPVWLVWRMNGEPVPLDHGGPYRLLTPGRYGVKNVKWPTEIAFVDTPHVSFWTEFNWDEDARYKANTFVLTPQDEVEVKVGERLRFGGSAFAGRDPIERVEVSFDGGPWEEATIDYDRGPDIWVLWSWDWVAVAGSHTIQARCFTVGGALSQPDPDGTRPYEGYDGSMLITVVAS